MSIENWNSMTYDFMAHDNGHATCGEENVGLISEEEGFCLKRQICFRMTHFSELSRIMAKTTPSGGKKMDEFLHRFKYRTSFIQRYWKDSILWQQDQKSSLRKQTSHFVTITPPDATELVTQIAAHYSSEPSKVCLNCYPRPGLPSSEQNLRIGKRNNHSHKINNKFQLNG